VPFSLADNIGDNIAQISMDAENLYRQVGQLLANVPALSDQVALTAEQMRWIGQASALVAISDDLVARANFEAAVQNFMQASYRRSALQSILLVLHRVMAAAELKAPPGIQGAFIPAANTLDGYAALAKVLGTPQRDVLIVDAYLDASVLIDYGGLVPDKVALRLLADSAQKKWAGTLQAATDRWRSQYPTRSLDVRLSAPGALHDRAIFVDGQTAWTLTQSIKDFAKTKHAEIIRTDYSASLKIPAYEAIWQAAQPI
jgi:hypothetical protein